MVGVSSHLSDWKLLRGRSVLGDAAAAWPAARAESPARTPFLSDRFFTGLLASATNRDRLCLASLHHGGTPLCALLLAGGRNGIWEAFTVPQLPMSLVSAHASVATLRRADVRRLFAQLPAFAWMIRVSRYDSDYHPAIDADLAAQCERLPLHRTTRVDVAGEFDAYWSARSQNLRGKIRSTLNRLQRSGITPRLVVLTDASELNVAVEAHGRLEATGWKGVEQTSLFHRGDERAFYQAVLSGFSASRQSRVYQLWFGDRLVASQMALVASGTMVLLKTAYDHSQGALSPGRLLDYFAIREAFAERDIRRIEYSNNASDDDLRWSTSHRHIHQLDLYRNAMIARAARSARHVRGMIRKAAPGRQPKITTEAA